MKAMKKLLPMILAVAFSMVAFTGVAFASSVTMDITEGDTHEYKVYQIYTGELADGVLSNIKYGNSGYGTQGESVPQSETDGITDADAFARSIANQVTTPVGTLKAGQTSLTDLADGYYLIVDDTAKQIADGDAYSAYIVEVAGSATISPKKDTTTSDKKITTDTLGKDSATTTVNGKIDNVSIGDTVNYEITGNVPTHATDYDYYFFIINDTLSTGLTFNPTSVVVKAGDATLTADTDYKLYTGDAADGKTFQVALTDAKAHAGKTITVTYSATLNENAVIGENHNDNTMSIEYSNNPNHNYNGDKDNDNPGKPKSDSHSPLGETPEKTTNTYTTGVQIQKVDQDGKVLTGAEFTITGDNEEIVLVSEETFAENADGPYWKLANNTYTTEAPITEDYMKQAAAGATEGYVVAEADYAGDDKITVGGTTYRPVKSGDTGTVYILMKANADQYADTTTNYAKTVTYTPKNTNTSGVEAKAVVGADGVVTFTGLGAGTYTITETDTPDGYNTVPPVTLDIAFTAEPASGSYHWSTTSSDASYNNATGVFEITVVNQKGNTLPSTGGMGTTILYIVGGVMIVLFGAALIARRVARKQS